MKPQALLILLFVAVLAAVAYFVVQGGGDPAPIGPPGGAGVTQSGDVATTTAKPESVAAADSGAAQEVVDRVNRTIVPDVAPADATASDCVLRGRLVDGAGAPRAGVVVQVDVWPGLDGVIDIQATSGETRQEITSAADGRFEVHVPLQRRGTFSLKDSELVFTEEQQFVAESAEQDLGDLVVVRSARLAGVVQDEDGKPVADVMVAAQLGAIGFGGLSGGKTGQDGSFSISKLAPGSWLLTTKSSQFLPTSQMVELAAEQQVTGLVIVVKPGQTIAGRVVDDRGVGVAGMKVASQRKQVVGGVDIERFTTDEAAITDELGNFRLAGLEGSTTTIRVTGPGHSKVTEPNVKIGSTNVELRVQRLGKIHGVLVSADGTPIAGSRISVKYPATTSSAMQIAESVADFDFPSSGPEVKTNAEGAFVIESVKPGLVTVKARGEAHLPVEQAGIRLEAAQEVRGIRLIADAGAIARIKVVDEQGVAVEGVTVSIKAAPKAQNAGYSMRVRSSDEQGATSVVFGDVALGRADTDSQGVATIMGLPAGEAVVTGSHRSYAPLADTPLVLPASGAVDRQVTMLPPSFVDVVVTNADGSVSAGTDVVIERPGGSPGGIRVGVGADLSDAPGGATVDKGKTNTEGKLRFGPLAAGEYVVTLSRGAKRQGVGSMMVFVGEDQDKLASTAKTIVVAAGKTATVAMVQPILASVTGRVIGSDGPLAGCVVELASNGGDDSIDGLGGNQERTGADGSFAFDGVESGDYTLRFGKPDQIVKASADLTVPPNTAEVHKDLTLRTGTVRVLVLSAEDAEPVERAEVRLTRGAEVVDGKSQPRQKRIMMVGFSTSSSGDGGDEEVSTMTFGDERVVTDADGVAVFEDVPIGDYTLKVSSRKFAPAEKQAVAVVERQLTDCGTVHLSGAGQIRGMVKDLAGKPIMAMVEHRLPGTEEWGRGEIAMRGSYRLTGLTAGDYEVRARPIGPDSNGRSESSEIQTVKVLVGKTAVADFTVK